MEETITFVGLNVHKNSIAVAFADGGLASEVRYRSLIDNTTDEGVGPVDRPPGATGSG